jgi:hypothetical protein
MTTWDLESIPMGTVDPMDRYRRRGAALSRPRPPQTAQAPRSVDSRAFARAVRCDRLRLAVVDPIGEWGAMLRVDHPTAVRGLRRMAAPARMAPPVMPASSDRRPSGRDLLDRLGADSSRGRGVMRCPAHEDRSPSMSWRLADDGRALVHCFAGCTFAEIVAAVR